MKTSLVCGSSGFIGTHAVRRLKAEGYHVAGVDIREPEYEMPDVFTKGDLRDNIIINEHVDEVWQLAANMGGAEFIFTGDNDAQIMHDSALINLNVLEACRQAKVGKVFFSSSACVYPEYAQTKPDSPALAECQAYPANPDSAYGWEKLFSERLYYSYARNYGLNVRVARFHNIMGPFGTWRGGREKAPAAICRKVAEADDGGTIDIIGDGQQTRSFLYIDECIEGIRRLMASDAKAPLNLGSSESISINDLVEMVASIANKTIHINRIPGPQGVRGRCSDNTRIREVLGWAPSAPLWRGMAELYSWISEQVDKDKK